MSSRSLLRLRLPSAMLTAAAWLVAGCTMQNPAFDERRETIADESGDGDGDDKPGDGDGDGKPGDGDGDDKPGDGDGDGDGKGDGDGDGDGEGEGDGDGDGDPGCAPPLRVCSGECVDTDSNQSNCGQCGIQCIGLCQDGACFAIEDRVVFVSSEPRTGMLAGLEGADDFCNELAGAAGLDGDYKAWLSTDELGPADRMFHSPVPYRLITGELVADNWADLTDGTLAHPIDRDESGQPVFDPHVCEGNEVWTNTKPDGTPASGLDCGGWVSIQGTSAVGRYSAVDGSWSAFNCPAVSCSSPLPIYCFQQ